MNTSGDAAELVVRIGLEGFEIMAKIAGAGAKHVAVLLYSIFKEEKKIKGKSRLTSMLRSGKEMKVFSVKKSDLKMFTQEAKKYGVLYCVLADRKNKDPKAEIDIVVRKEDALKINRIVDRFHLAVVDTASIVTADEKSKDFASSQKEPDKHAETQADKEKLLDDLMGTLTKGKESDWPSETEKRDAPIQPKSVSRRHKNDVDGVSKSAKKPSVREELRKIKKNHKEKETDAISLDDKSLVKTYSKKTSTEQGNKTHKLKCKKTRGGR